MKKLTNRAFSLLLALAMCISVFGGIQIEIEAAAVDYVYAGDYILNWGVRGTTATYLSQNAEAFYENNNISYDDLAALSGASDTSKVPSSELFGQLHELMFYNIDMWSSYTSQYGATRYLYQYTDCQNSGKTSTAISCFYTGKTIGPEWDGGSTWNREHTWPNSKGTGESSTSALREADIMMLRPTDAKTNTGRGNTAYGESSGYYNPNKNTGGAYDVRGDVARILLYVYTCWGGHSNATYHNGALDYMWGSSGVIESKEVLLSWMEEDPVDTWELGRNDSVESITGTRNVFVDYPELAFMLFDEEIPSGYTTPSGEGSSGGEYKITAVSGNTAYGTVSLNGKIITATPKTGYEIVGYTVTAGSADVVRSGNNFTVTAYSNVTVQIDFRPRAQMTVRYAEYGTVTGSATAYSGDTVVLPSLKNALQDGHRFVGWVTEQTGDTENIPTLYAAGSSYTVTQDQTLHALYSRTEAGGTGTSTQFEPYTGTLTEGDYIIVDNASGAYAMNTTVSSNRLQYTAVSFTDGDILDPSADIIWTFAYDNGYWTMYNASKNAYAGGTGTKNQAKMLTSVTTMAQWSVVYKTETTYEFINRGHDEKGINPMLRKNGSYGFACYATTTNVGAPLYLYKRASGTIYYFTQIGEAVCVHNDTGEADAIAPGCETVGYTAGVYCNDCDEFISGHQEIPANGHSYENGVCTVCDASAYDVMLLTEDTTVTLSLTEDLYIDLCGYDMTGTVRLNGYKVYGMDSATDKYTCEAIGYFTCADENGDPVVPERVCAYGTTRYLTINTDGGYSFHRFFVGVTHMSLEPETVGLGYKTAVYGDEMVFGELAADNAVTFRLQLEGYNGVYRYFDSDELSDGEPITLRIRNYDVENYSEHKLYAQVSLTLSDGTVIETQEVDLSFRWLTEQVNANYTDYTDRQLAQIREMLQSFAIVQTWDIPNLV